MTLGALCTSMVACTRRSTSERFAFCLAEGATRFFVDSCVRVAFLRGGVCRLFAAEPEDAEEYEDADEELEERSEGEELPLLAFEWSGEPWRSTKLGALKRCFAYSTGDAGVELGMFQRLVENRLQRLEVGPVACGIGLPPRGAEVGRRRVDDV